MSKKAPKSKGDCLTDFLHRQPTGRVCKTPEELLDCISELGVAGPPAEWLQKEIDDALSSLKRDEQRQAGPRKPRGSRWPELDAWIEAKLRKRDYTTDELFGLLPEVEDEDCEGFYRDGDEIVSAGKTKPLGRKGFEQRVTKTRQKIKAPR